MSKREVSEPTDSQRQDNAACCYPDSFTPPLTPEQALPSFTKALRELERSSVVSDDSSLPCAQYMPPSPISVYGLQNNESFSFPSGVGGGTRNIRKMPSFMCSQESQETFRSISFPSAVAGGASKIRKMPSPIYYVQDSRDAFSFPSAVAGEASNIQKMPSPIYYVQDSRDAFSLPSAVAGGANNIPKVLSPIYVQEDSKDAFSFPSAVAGGASNIRKVLSPMYVQEDNKDAFSLPSAVAGGASNIRKMPSPIYYVQDSRDAFSFPSAVAGGASNIQKMPSPIYVQDDQDAFSAVAGGASNIQKMPSPIYVQDSRDAFSLPSADAGGTSNIRKIPSPIYVHDDQDAFSLPSAVAGGSSNIRKMPSPKYGQESQDSYMSFGSIPSQIQITVHTSSAGPAPTTPAVPTQSTELWPEIDWPEIDWVVSPEEKIKPSKPTKAGVVCGGNHKSTEEIKLRKYGPGSSTRIVAIEIDALDSSKEENEESCSRSGVVQKTWPERLLMQAGVAGGRSNQATEVPRAPAATTASASNTSLPAVILKRDLSDYPEAENVAACSNPVGVRVIPIKRLLMQAGVAGGRSNQATEVPRTPAATTASASNTSLPAVIIKSELSDFPAAENVATCSNSVAVQGIPPKRLLMQAGVAGGRSNQATEVPRTPAATTASASNTSLPAVIIKSELSDFPAAENVASCSNSVAVQGIPPKRLLTQAGVAGGRSNQATEVPRAPAATTASASNTSVPAVIKRDLSEAENVAACSNSVAVQGIPPKRLLTQAGVAGGRSNQATEVPRAPAATTASASNTSVPAVIKRDLSEAENVAACSNSVAVQGIPPKRLLRQAGVAGGRSNQATDVLRTPAATTASASNTSLPAVIIKSDLSDFPEAENVAACSNSVAVQGIPPKRLLTQAGVAGGRSNQATEVPRAPAATTASASNTSVPAVILKKDLSEAENVAACSNSVAVQGIPPKRLLMSAVVAGDRTSQATKIPKTQDAKHASASKLLLMFAEYESDSTEEENETAMSRAEAMQVMPITQAGVSGGRSNQATEVPRAPAATTASASNTSPPVVVIDGDSSDSSIEENEAACLDSEVVKVTHVKLQDPFGEALLLKMAARKRTRSASQPSSLDAYVRELLQPSKKTSRKNPKK